MIINIDDSLSGEEKQEQLIYQLVKNAFQSNGFVRKNAAEWLGVSQRTLYNWSKKYPEFNGKYFHMEKETLSEDVIKLLPPTFTECSRSLFYRYAERDQKELIVKYYKQKESQNGCEHLDYTVHLREVGDRVIPMRVCCNCKNEIAGITNEEIFDTLAKVRSFNSKNKRFKIKCEGVV